MIGESEKAEKVVTLDQCRQAYTETQNKIFEVKKRRESLKVQDTTTEKVPQVKKVEVGISQVSSLFFISIALVVTILVPILIIKYLQSHPTILEPFKSWTNIDLLKYI